MTKLYAYKTPKKSGFVYSWDECKEAILGVKGAQCKKFTSIDEAEQWLMLDDKSTSSKKSLYAFRGIGVFDDWGECNDLYERVDHDDYCKLPNDRASSRISEVWVNTDKNTDLSLTAQKLSTGENETVLYLGVKVDYKKGTRYLGSCWRVGDRVIVPPEVQVLTVDSFTEFKGYCNLLRDMTYKVLMGCEEVKTSVKATGKVVVRVLDSQVSEELMLAIKAVLSEQGYSYEVELINRYVNSAIANKLRKLIKSKK